MLTNDAEHHIEVDSTDLTQLNNEPGCHKLQRVPPTERNGRVHTSAVTVAVLDPSLLTTAQPTVDPKDLKVEWYSGTGCGGQNRNKVQTSCRLTHIPTGIVQTAQTRSRENSYAQALSGLAAALAAREQKTLERTVSAHRQSQRGNGVNSNLVRTYCYQHGIVRSVNGNTITIKQLEKGGLDLLWL